MSRPYVHLVHLTAVGNWLQEVTENSVIHFTLYSTIKSNNTVSDLAKTQLLSCQHRPSIVDVVLRQRRRNGWGDGGARPRNVEIVPTPLCFAGPSPTR